MTNLTKFAAFVVAVALTAAVARGEDKVENPEFKSWSKFKSGSTVTLKVSNEGSGVASETTITTKLVEVKDDKLVLETASVSKLNGMELKQPAEKRDVPKNLDKAPEGYDPKSDKPQGTTEEGKKKVKVGGTEYECKWYKTKNKVKLPTGDEEVEGEFWMSDEVPGKLVKMVNKGKTFTSTMEATEITIKK